MIRKFVLLFPIWAIIGSIIAYIQPELVIGYKYLIIPLLTLIMFSMGVTLSLDDFKRVVKKPKLIAITTILQFAIMPFTAYFISKVLNFSDELMIGMILVGAVSGGTASNVIAYLAKADVALSITMTIVSTLLSILVTPYLTLFYVGETIDVPATSMILSILKIVILPVFLGVFINHFFKNFINKNKDIFALFSIASIVFIIAIIVGLNAQRIATIASTLLFGIALHNLIGLIGGYIMLKILGYGEKECRTVAIEVGMQNSGLAVALAMKYFTALSALPGAIFSIWHNISGSLVASYWAKKCNKKEN